jgi:purine-binding chemotaxis protein CheW
METRQLATFTVDTLLFGVEVYKVQEVIRYQEMTPVPLAAHGAAGLINLRGQVVTAIDMRTRLGLPPRAEGERPMNVVVRVDDEPVSLLVDAIGDVAQVSSDQFEEPPETMTGPGRGLITGAYKLENRLLLALDVARAVDIGLSV